MARTTWSGPVPKKDLSVFAKVLSVTCARRRKVTLRQICWYKPAGVVEKEIKARRVKKSQAKGTKSMGRDTKKKGMCHNCKESNNSSSSGGRDLSFMTYTGDQPQWIIVLAEVDQVWGRH